MVDQTIEESAPKEERVEISSKESCKEKDKEKEPIEYNPRWDGYTLILFSSLLNFAAISAVPTDERKEYWIMSMAFGTTTFTLALLILVQDRLQLFVGIFHYTKARDGYLEGYCLAVSVIWWFVGVGYITKPGGIAYVASNIYYSAWVSLVSCVYTLNGWSTEKDILSIAEMTNISTTLRSWYLHFLSACVVFGSSVHLHSLLYSFDEIQDTSFGVAIGFVSLFFSLFFILVHYNFFPLEEGGWTELFSSLFLILIWIIGVAILTADGGIAATMEGNQCYRDPTAIEKENCTIILYLTDTSGADSRFEVACEQLPRQVPGSNLYFACWFCLLSAFNVALRWKAAQAMNFARAREEQELKELANKGEDGSSDGNDDVGNVQDDELNDMG
ncbi:hypothetical protein IV203_032840 [Nitzschia inconspicua]|uniref:Uncharacterized protein n=1 Tax=Nitzschia inconspicua TaxID=303405 RepID=A0A9K3KLG1_9STRA|nr:hypothetical protein IV203_032840 [Nitzschia inconspicua]